MTLRRQLVCSLLFDLAPPVIESLDSFQCKAAVEHHGKWKQQIIDIITELHSHDIVWGDVHPGNIFIDKNFDALCGGFWWGMG